MRVEEGHFGNVELDGLSFVVTLSFQGPLHEGNGTIQPIIDERADAEQRDESLPSYRDSIQTKARYSISSA
jgi:hypothetical protein